jgi:UDP-glucose 4-epimerase
MIIERPTWTIENNVICTGMLLKLSSRYHKRTFLASTSEVYGKNPQASFDELTASVIGPTVRNRWGYATSKLIDEFLGLAYAAEKGLPATICRFFNTVGPRQTGRYGMVVPISTTRRGGADPSSCHSAKQRADARTIWPGRSGESSRSPQQSTHGG